MVNKICIHVFFIISFNLLADVKFKGISIFEEVQDSASHCMDKTVYHKKWNDYLSYISCTKEKSIIEELFEETWYICGPQEQGFSMNISATRWDDTGNGYDKKTWQIKTKGSTTKAERDFFKVTQNGCCGKPDIYLYYSMKSGKYLCRLSPELFAVSIDGKTKYFGYIPTVYADSADKIKDFKEYQGIMYLFSDTAVIATKFVKTSAPNDHIPDFSWNGSQIELLFQNCKVKGKIENDKIIILK